MTHPNLSVAATGRPDAEARRLGMPGMTPQAGPASQAASAPQAASEQAPASESPAGEAQRADDAAASAGPNADLAELGAQFAGLTRLLDEITSVGKGLPRSDVDAMMKPIFAVLKGIMARIIGAPAITIADLGIKAQVVMWGNRDWWEADAKLGWQDTATKALIEQTVAAAGLELPRAKRPIEISEPAA